MCFLPHGHLGLIDNRRYCAGNQIPVRTQFYGNNRLNIKDVLEIVPRSHAEVEVVLERDAD